MKESPSKRSALMRRSLLLPFYCAMLLVGLLALSPGVISRQPMGTLQGAVVAAPSLCPAQATPVSGPTVADVLTQPISSLVSQIASNLFDPVRQLLCSFYDDVTTWLPGQQFVYGTGAGVTYQQAAVLSLWNNGILLADAALALAILLGGYATMYGWQSAYEMLPRVVLAAVAIQASKIFIPLLVSLNNALCSSALTAGFHSADHFDLAREFLLGLNPVGAIGIQAVFAYLLITMALIVDLQMLVRVGLLDVLIIFAPVGLLGYALPQWQRWANFWMSAFFCTLFVQFVQISAIALGAALVATLAGALPVGLLAGVAILFLVLRIPGWLANTVTSALGAIESPAYYTQQAMQAVAGFVLRNL